jgi:hypothetical protein
MAGEFRMAAALALPMRAAVGRANLSEQNLYGGIQLAISAEQSFSGILSYLDVHASGVPLQFCSVECHCSGAWN